MKFKKNRDTRTYLNCSEFHVAFLVALSVDRIMPKVEMVNMKLFSNTSNVIARNNYVYSNKDFESLYYFTHNYF